MTDTVRKPDDRPEAQANGTRTSTGTQPIVIRKLDRLETTQFCFSGSG
jgi:hypothetical protein